jgi:hypothetical protein
MNKTTLAQQRFDGVLHHTTSDGYMTMNEKNFLFLLLKYPQNRKLYSEMFPSNKSTNKIKPL